MPRIKNQINKDELQKVINELEKDRDFANLTELFTAVANSEWGRRNKITAGVVYLRVKEFNLKLKTQPGKRGAGNPHLATLKRSGPRTKKSEKFAKHPEVFQRLINAYPDSYHNLIGRLQKGSSKAAITLKCLDCCNLNKNEIKWCTIKECALWLIRPYQPKAGESETT